MIKIEQTEVSGWCAAIRGMRNPMNSWEKNDSYELGVDPISDKINHVRCIYQIGKNDLDLMTRLRNAGTDHRKFMRMITVYVDITAPLYWWKEFDTYKIGTVANSCSTMHKIAEKEFTLEDFSCEHLSNEEFGVNGLLTTTSRDILGIVIDALNMYRRCFIEDGKSKDDWWQMIQLLPSSYNQRRTVMLNYEVLANIYKSRKHHKLDEWHGFCEWIEQLPYGKLITFENIKAGWISVDEGMPEEGREVLVTVESDESYGRGTDIQHDIDLAVFHKDDGYIKSAAENGYFDTDNDWDEGQPLSIIAWMERPVPYCKKKKGD